MARLAPRVAVLVAIVLYASLLKQLLVGPRFVIPILEGILLIAFGGDRSPTDHPPGPSVSNDVAGVDRHYRVDKPRRGRQLGHDLVRAQVKGGGTLVRAALQVWATNVVAFALI